MPLESCMLVLDNSEYMRNGDYAPTRFQAQAQAVSTVFTAKTDSNPESAVGLMTMAGKSPSLLVTPTNDIGKLLSALSKSQIGGTPDLQTSVQIAQLALKHRENKNQRQRIVVFVGSPLEDSQESLVKLGKKLRKNNVLVDVVSFGEEGMENDEKLGALVEAAGGGESHLVSVPPGPHLLADIIISSPILFDGEAGGRGGQGVGEGGEGGDGGDGFDPNMDPELAMAIRMSLQEAEQAQRAQAGPSTTTEPMPTEPIATDFLLNAHTRAGEQSAESSTEAGTILPDTMTKPLFNADDPVLASASGDAGDETMDDADEDEEEMLKRAMALSRGDAGDEDVQMDDDGDDDEEDEEAAIARAIAMSLAESEGKDEEKK